MKRKSFLHFAIAALVCAACSSAPEERKAENKQSLTQACVVSYTGEAVPWLVDQTCSCPPGLNNEQLDECTYQTLVIDCLRQQGLAPSCPPPPLPRAAASDNRVWTVLDLQWLSEACEVQKGLFTCIDGVNAGIAPSGAPYHDAPVDADFRDFCAPPPVLPRCETPHLDVFDPCGKRSCDEY